ncbi:MAG: 50S ribosomal protein L22 [Candidatus Portnoybacteria bacterium CG10_big_fil_rev_8_21_14_0_10_36_7]|uniref:Large ribosomal subunit protein uL22 n=1 Tax=Candidatus Portnoybacteria bacterium CG10_big_fil_rev_8_21_14_0_10_36_7 TaxID=1974812 RepID=A0A2M8KDF6_9BACT|nr:MAG: 50S ribosomal protein L22 [Candidatus Portnoybacteria bacterium CG10_big_fil_rev_8_21_14_0_10_36_7]
MQVIAKLNNLRIAPRKVRLVVNLVKKMPIEQAKAQLKFLSKRSTLPVFKLLKSAQSNAVQNFGIEKENLFVKEIKVDEARMMKRWLPRAFGRATPIQKKSSHISVVLEEITAGKGRVAEAKISKPIEVVESLSEKTSIDSKGSKLKTGDAKSHADVVEPKKKLSSKPGLKGMGKVFRRKTI